MLHAQPNASVANYCDHSVFRCRFDDRLGPCQKKTTRPEPELSGSTSSSKNFASTSRTCASWQSKPPSAPDDRPPTHGSTSPKPEISPYVRSGSALPSRRNDRTTSQNPVRPAVS